MEACTLVQVLYILNLAFLTLLGAVDQTNDSGFDWFECKILEEPGHRLKAFKHNLNLYKLIQTHQKPLNSGFVW